MTTYEIVSTPQTEYDMTSPTLSTRYHQLLQGLRDLVGSGRLTEADLPDDFTWLNTQLTELARFDAQSVSLLMMSAEERNTLLAALRAYQRNGYGNPAAQPDWASDLASNGGTESALDDDGIDALCEKVNCA